MSDKIVYLHEHKDLAPADALKIIKEVSQDSGRVFFSHHAEKRMRQRRITRTQVLRCLRTGYISEGPFFSIKNNWECTVEGFSAGQQIALEVAIETHEHNNTLIIITVMKRS